MLKLTIYVGTASVINHPNRQRA